MKSVGTVFLSETASDGNSKKLPLTGKTPRQQQFFVYALGMSIAIDKKAQNVRGGKGG